MPENIFKWPVSVPSGHQSYTTLTGNIRKNIQSIIVVKDDLTVIDLFNDKEIDEVERLTLICAAVGTYGGIRYKLSAGYVVAACLNAPATLKPSDPNNPTAVSIANSEWGKARIEVRYEDTFRKCPVEYLMNAVFIMGAIIDMSDVPIAVVEKLAEEKKPEPLSDAEIDRIFKKLDK